MEVKLGLLSFLSSSRAMETPMAIEELLPVSLAPQTKPFSRHSHSTTRGGIWQEQQPPPSFLSRYLQSVRPSQSSSPSFAGGYQRQRSPDGTTLRYWGSSRRLSHRLLCFGLEGSVMAAGAQSCLCPAHLFLL